MAGGRTYLPGRCLSAAAIRARVAARRAGRARRSPTTAAPDRGAGPARYFRLVRDDDGHEPARRFGIISPMTEHFCDSCNRLRLSTTGRRARLSGPRRRRRSAWRLCGPAIWRRSSKASGRRSPPSARAHLRSGRARRPPQGDGTDRRMSDLTDPEAARAGAAARVRGEAGRAGRDPQRQHGSRAAPGHGRLRPAGQPLPARGRGAKVDLIDTGGFPMVLGRFEVDPTLPTVTVYNHLDVQPADQADGWRSPPFQFTREPDGEEPIRWFARGSTDDKGPALAALMGARLARETSAPVNIQFLWELEEEIGSPHFAAGLAKAVAGDAASGLAGLATDSVVVSDTIWTAAGHPSISYGLRGLMGFTIALETGAKDVHSGTTGGLARNPIAELAALIAEMFDGRTGKVKIPGFYDGVRRISAAEKKAFGRAGFAAQAVRRRARAEEPAEDGRRRERAGRADRRAHARGSRHHRRLQRARHQDHRPAPRRSQAVDPAGPGPEAGQGLPAHQEVRQGAAARRGRHARGVSGALPGRGRRPAPRGGHGGGPPDVRQGTGLRPRRAARSARS